MNKALIFLFVLIGLLSCNPKNQQEQINNKKQNSMTTSKKLENVDFFKFIDDSIKLLGYKKLIDEKIQKSNWLTFPNNRYLNIQLENDNKSKFSTPEYRTVEIYGDDMYQGNFKSYLEDIKLILDKRNLRFDLGDEDLFWGEKTQTNHYFKHTIQINGTEYIIFEGNLEDRSINHPQIYVERTLEVLNSELAKQDSLEKFVLLTHQEHVYYIMGTTEIIKTIREIANDCNNKLIENN